LAITLHNIPEGLAVGVLFGGVAAGFDGATIGGAVALALGIGLQNSQRFCSSHASKAPGTF